MTDNEWIIIITVFFSMYPNMAGSWVMDRPEKARCEAVIMHEKSEQKDLFQGAVINSMYDTIEGRYTMETIREGVAGSSVSRQAGHFTVTGKQKKKLSRTSVNIDDRDTYKVVLKVYADNRLMCADSIVVKSNR